MKQYLMKNISMIFRCSTLYRDTRLADFSLTGYQSTYVMPICETPGITQDALAQRLHVNRSTVTRQLAFLEESGYVTRTRCESDRRAIEVYPTEKMKEVLPVVLDVMSDWRNSLTCILTKKETDALALVLDKLAQRAETLV